jgi:squalene monooxygenase
MQSKTVARKDVDVLIAGGGVAGSAAAAALSQLGLKILIVEPKESSGRRLAGELIHPPGIEGLYELGLMDRDAPLGRPVKGFSIFPFAEGLESIILPYGESKSRVAFGQAIEHNELKDHLLARVRALEGVEVWIGARVTEMRESTNGQAFSALVGRDEGDVEVHAKLIIGADGAMSQLRKMAGIGHDTQRYSGMVGVEVDDEHLPHPGYGNIFLNPAGVSYAYGIGKGRARVMFEVLKGADFRESIKSHLENFPAAFRARIETELAAAKPMAAANYCIVPERSVKGNLALVGDARGCCHPLTASGITSLVKDALALRDALRETRLNMDAALRKYSRHCGRLQLTRRTLAEELRAAFLAQTPEASLLHQCIFSYWRHSPKGRVHSMELLSMLDNSIYTLATQFALVALHSLRLFPIWYRNGAMGAWWQGVFKLLLQSLSFPNAAISLWWRELRAAA